MNRQTNNIMNPITQPIANPDLKNRFKNTLDLLKSGGEVVPEVVGGKTENKLRNTFLEKILNKISILGREKQMIWLDSLILAVCLGFNCYTYSSINALNIKNGKKPISSLTVVIAIGVILLFLLARLFIFRFPTWQLPGQSWVVTGWQPWIKSTIILSSVLACQWVVYSQLVSVDDGRYIENDIAAKIKSNYLYFCIAMTVVIIGLTVYRIVIFTGPLGPTFEKDRREIRDINSDIASDIITNAETNNVVITNLKTQNDVLLNQNQQLARQVNDLSNTTNFQKQAIQRLSGGV